MKKFISLALAVVLLCLCSCGKSEQVSNTVKRAGTLEITNEEKTYLGCRSRLEAVLTSIKTTVNILEEQHNAEVRAENNSDYFLNADYILTAFEPFSSGTIDMTDLFDDEMTDEKAQSAYKLESGGMDIEFIRKSDDEYQLRFVSEELTKTYGVEYDKKNDAFRFVYTTDSELSGRTREFLEFVRTADGVYLIQSSTARCAAGFDEEGNLVSLYCVELADGSFSVDESVYPSIKLMSSQVEVWVNKRGEDAFVRMHTLTDGVLVHKDKSTGEMKTIEIVAANYASAFYA